MIGKQKGAAIKGARFQFAGNIRVAWAVIRNDRQRADAHHVIRRKRAQGIGAVEVLQAGQRGEVGRVQMDNGVAGGVFTIQREVKDGFLARLVASEQVAVAIEYRQPLRREPSQRGAGRGNEEALPLKTTGEVTRTAHAVAALEQRFCQRDHLLLLLKLGHANIPCAWAKKSSLPKLPDLSAR